MNKIRITTHRYVYMGLAYDTIIEIACKLKGEYKNDVCFNHNGKQWTLSEGQGDFEYVDEEKIGVDTAIDETFEKLNKMPADKFFEKMGVTAMQATDFLSKALTLLEERGKDYDQPQGERSMGKTVQAFNAITGHTLKESEGWLLLQLLKDVRQWSNPDSYHADSAEDCISYAALKAEALVEGK